MGYFDALTSSSFKRTAEGQRLFFPWGVLGRGYAVANEDEFQRLRRSVKIGLLVLNAAVIVAIVWQGLLVGGAISVALCGLYTVWILAQKRRLIRTDVRLSLSESFANQARDHSAAALWLLELGSLAFVGVGVFALLTAPEKWLPGLVLIGFFGLCAAGFARMLVLKMRTGSAQP